MPRNSNLVMEKVTWMAAWMAILQLIPMDTHQSIRSSAQRWHSSALRLSWSIWTNKIFHQNWATWTSQMIDSKYFGVILLLSYTSCFSPRSFHIAFYDCFAPIVFADLHLCFDIKIPQAYQISQSYWLPVCSIVAAYYYAFFSVIVMMIAARGVLSCWT